MCVIRSSGLRQAARISGKPLTPQYKKSLLGARLSILDTVVSLEPRVAVKGLAKLLQGWVESSQNRNLPSCPPEDISYVLEGGLYMWLYLDYDGPGQHRAYIGEGYCIVFRTGLYYSTYSMFSLVE